MDNSSDNNIIFDKNGTCNYCTDTLKRLPLEFFPGANGKKKLDTIMDRIKADGVGEKYDCMVGVSGGVDSSYVIYLGHKYGLRMLAVHVDDGLDTEIAIRNVDNICKQSKTDIIMVKPDLDQYKDLLRSFFLARVPNLAIPQDNILVAALNDTASKYNLKYNLSGVNFSLECILERSTGRIDALDKKHILAIHKKFGKGRIDKLRLATFYEKYIHNRYFNRTISVSPLNFIDYNLETALKELGDFSNYVYYGGKHYESILTRFLQCYYLPERYGFDKRKSHFSSMIVTDQMTRDEALEKISKPTYLSNELKEFDLSFLANYLSLSRREFDVLLMQPNKAHYDYPISQLNKVGGIARRFRKYLG
jgi:N-acetyl sugar amidotransferase